MDTEGVIIKVLNNRYREVEKMLTWLVSNLGAAYIEQRPGRYSISWPIAVNGAVRQHIVGGIMRGELTIIETL
jgi:hypothetical protein